MGQEIIYCSRCQTRIVGGDFDRGDAFRVGEESVCGKCGMELLSKAPVAVQQQILEQKKRALDRKSAPPPVARGLTGSSTQVRKSTPAEGPSRTAIAVLAGIGLTLVLLVGMLVMSSKPPPPPPPAPAPKVVDAGPSPQELAARGALKVAQSYAREHPAEHDEQARMFEKIASEYAGTSAFAEAKRELESIARRKKEAAAAELAGLLSRAREMAGSGGYQKAVDALEAAKKKSADPQWTRPIDEKAKEYSDAMAKEFPALRDRAVDARKRDGTAELQLIQSQVAAWGSARYSEELEKALVDVFPPIAQKDNGNYMLRISEATVVGKKLKRSGDGEWSILSEWREPKDYVEWTAVSRQGAGPFTLKLNYTVPAEYKGSPFGGDVTVTAGDQTRSFTLQSTKTWGDYTTFSYGTMMLPAGTFKVTVRPAKIVNNLMSLRYVQFVPEK